LLLPLTIRGRAAPHQRSLQHMGWVGSIVLAHRRPTALTVGAPRDFKPPVATTSPPSTPAPANRSSVEDWPSGKFELDVARSDTRWPDGQPVGRGFPQPYLQDLYADAVAAGRKTVEGRPGGGWMKSGVRPNDYIRFKIPRRPGRTLIVLQRCAMMSSERCSSPSDRRRPSNHCGCPTFRNRAHRAPSASDRNARGRCVYDVCASTSPSWRCLKT